MGYNFNYALTKDTIEANGPQPLGSRQWMLFSSHADLCCATMDKSMDDSSDVVYVRKSGTLDYASSASVRPDNRGRRRRGDVWARLE